MLVQAGSSRCSLGVRVQVDELSAFVLHCGGRVWMQRFRGVCAVFCCCVTIATALNVVVEEIEMVG